MVERLQRALGKSLWSRVRTTKTLRLAPTTWAAASLVGVVAYLIGTPLVGLLLGSITDTPPGVSPHFTLASLAYAYGEYEHFISLLNSIAFAGLTASLVLILGGGLAWAAARTDSMVRHFVDLFALAPILIPSVVFVSG